MLELIMKDHKLSVWLDVPVGNAFFQQTDSACVAMFALLFKENRRSMLLKLTW